MVQGRQRVICSNPIIIILVKVIKLPYTWNLDELTNKVDDLYLTELIIYLSAG